MRLAPGDPDVFDRCAYYLAALRDDDQLLLFGIDDHPHADEGAGSLGDRHRIDALAATRVSGVFLQRRELAVAPFGNHQQVGTFPNDVEAGHQRVLSQRDGAYAGGISTHRARLLLAEADRLTVGGGDDQFIRA